jgi:hypothetical protein
MDPHRQKKTGPNLHVQREVKKEKEGKIFAFFELLKK